MSRRSDAKAAGKGAGRRDHLMTTNNNSFLIQKAIAKWGCIDRGRHARAGTSGSFRRLYAFDSCTRRRASP